MKIYKDNPGNNKSWYLGINYIKKANVIQLYMNRKLYLILVNRKRKIRI